ncbi:hypothetical protein HID58_081962 [Brassica napus]|uniref:Uncharacterized protein n=1 Tax=Brassica napus TaxID=3708 RepID=A0ABQ7Y983_BRANA|nr:hypothetical protein HID58_081962 [Brassica napus]
MFTGSTPDGGELPIMSPNAVLVSLSRVLRKKDDRRVSASPPSSLVFAVRSSPPSLIIIIRWVYRFWISGAEAGACDNGLRLRSRLQRDVLRLQFMAQFCRSTIPNDFESSRHEQSHESESELLRFEDEEIEESYQRLREREISHAYLRDCAKAYCSTMDHTDLIPRLRLIMVQWILQVNIIIMLLYAFG